MCIRDSYGGEITRGRINGRIQIVEEMSALLAEMEQEKSFLQYRRRSDEMDRNMVAATPDMKTTGKDQIIITTTTVTTINVVTKIIITIITTHGIMR